MDPQKIDWGQLEDIIDKSYKEIRLYLIETSYSNIAASLKTKYGSTDQQIQKLLAPLKDYEEKYGKRRTELLPSIKTDTLPLRHIPN